jgi:glucose/arabinose dehydrogenase
MKIIPNRSASFTKTLRPSRPSSESRLTVERLECRLLLATLPDGFTESAVASGISNPTAMEIAPDGRIFDTEQAGRLRVIENGNLLATPFLTKSVNSAGERGLLGVAFDPNFTSNQFVYVYYTTASSPIHNRVSRFTANGNVAVPGSELVILDLNNLTGAENHNGGAIHFGEDGKLYIGVGDNANGANSQSLGNLLGKILRIDPDGSIPTDNPFFNTATGQNRAIWTRGLRNPFTFAVQPGTGRVFINDVGQSDWEEINDGVAGSNYGWPTTEGPTGNPQFRTPVFSYPHSGPVETSGCAISGGSFYNPTLGQFPADYTGDYFFADYCNGWIRRYDPVTDQVTAFATDFDFGTVDLKVDAAGSLYYLSRGFDSNTGQVTRVDFPGNQAPAITQQPADRRVAVGQPATFSVSAAGTQPLSFQWQRDGVVIPGATGATLTLNSTTLADDGALFRVMVSNVAGNVTSNDATLTVVDNQPPTATIDTPLIDTMYDAGDTINFAGTGTDPEQGNLPAAAFTWEVVFHHAAHTHPFIQPFSGQTGGSFQIPTTGETAADVFYRIHLTVTDEFGFTGSTTRDLTPNTSMITLDTNPPGLQLQLDDQPTATAISFESVVGFTRTLGVTSPQQFGGTWYRFAAWSDAGTARHEIATPGDDTSYSATFVAIGRPTVTDLRVTSPSKNARRVFVSFSEPLDPDTAANPANFQIIAAGRDKRFDSPGRPSSDDVTMDFDPPIYSQTVDPISAVIHSTVTIDVPTGMRKNTFYLVNVDSTNTGDSPNAVAGLNGNLLDGEFAAGFPSGDGTDGGDFAALIALGDKLDYTDRSGDEVSLSMSKSGVIEMVREAPAADGVRAEAATMRLGATPRSKLTGRVKPAGTTSIARVTGLLGVRNNIQNNPSFVLGQVSAMVVDRVLDSRSSAHDRFDDLIAELLPRLGPM